MIIMRCVFVLSSMQQRTRRPIFNHTLQDLITDQFARTCAYNKICTHTQKVHNMLKGAEKKAETQR